jgi:predicted metal-dependent RNase
LKLSFLGGSREVGKSCVMVEAAGKTILLDCGVKLGKKHLFPQIKQPRDIDLILISHAHLDHVGYLPFLFRDGCRAKIITTKPTRDLSQLLLSDYLKVAKIKGEAPYSHKDIINVLKHMEFLRYRERKRIKDVEVRLFNAGHILGSAVLQLTAEGKRIVYTGDMSYRATKLMDHADRDIEKPDIFITETTYGSRNDIIPSLKENTKRLASSVKETLKRGGQVLIPAFGVGRSQEILYLLENLVRSKAIPEIPIFMDGMVKKACKIYRQNILFLKEEVTMRILISGEDPFKSKYFRLPSTKDKRDVLGAGPAVIVASSGMLTGGPSVFYLSKLVENPLNTVILVGYQVKGTMGRFLQDGEDTLNINNEEYKVKTHVDSVHFSAHADYQQLMNFINEIPRPGRVFTMHGDDGRCEEFAEAVTKKMKVEATAPENGEAYEV